MSEHRDLKARVLHHLLQNKGKTVFLEKMVSELDEPARRIQQSISFLRRQNKINVITTVKGHSWYVEPDTNEDNRIKWAQIMELPRTGRVLLERQDGKVFIADLTEVE